jgi:hypothetical protein
LTSDHKGESNHISEECPPSVLIYQDHVLLLFSDALISQMLWELKKELKNQINLKKQKGVE